ncbi:MAG: bifunctional 3,4-dihydroxy-2-butanone-4-phosphate synthase/GTP cyclohydrolase II [Pseudomonadota bacterium]
MAFSSIPELIEEMRLGRMIILIDDEDRENEGDLVMAAQWVRPEDINFMARYGRGLVCLTLTRERCTQLNLPLMVANTQQKQSTSFTLSIEAAKGVTTGISAADRATTIRAAVAPDARPEDIVQPGHVFPIMAQPGGVLTRAGHTEATSDLARMAGLEPAAVIVEILNEDGTMARRPDLEKFAAQHGLKMGTIADLIYHRLRHEKTVERVTECRLNTDFGPFRLMAYRDIVDAHVHLALVRGEVNTSEPVLVRVHMRDDMSDVLSAHRPDVHLPLRKAMEYIAKQGQGVIVLLRRPETASDLVRRIEHYHLLDAGQTPPAETPWDQRSYGLGAQILLDLGVHKMRVVGNPKKMAGLSGFGLEVVEYLPPDTL